MLAELVIGTAMIGTTVVMHALALDFIIRHIRKLESFISYLKHSPWKPLVLAAIVLAIFTAHVVEIWIWAALYFFIGAFPDFENSLYFSTTAFTTVGFGDAIPVHAWRLLGAIEGANGFMLFGWSTAFTFEVLSHLYRKESKDISMPEQS